MTKEEAENKEMFIGSSTVMRFADETIKRSNFFAWLYYIPLSLLYAACVNGIIFLVLFVIVSVYCFVSQSCADKWQILKSLFDTFSPIIFSYQYMKCGINFAPIQRKTLIDYGQKVPNKLAIFIMSIWHTAAIIISLILDKSPLIPNIAGIAIMCWFLLTGLLYKPAINKTGS